LTGFNDLATTHPQLLQQVHGWDPRTVSAGSAKKLEWVCAIGHQWKAVVYSRAISGLNCPICSGQQVLMGYNDLQTTHPWLASQAFGWDPTTVSRGSGKKVMWFCDDGHKWKSVVSSRVAGSGCPSCAVSGFDPNNEGWLYFLKHPQWQMLQIGITNFPDDRLRDHKKLGWKLIELRGPMDGLIAREWETSILQMLKANGADLSNKEIAGKFDGYSEAWSESTFPAKSLRNLMNLVEENE
jgi:Zn ribbon nucleic-acid-binding protein